MVVDGTGGGRGLPAELDGDGAVEPTAVPRHRLGDPGLGAPGPQDGGAHGPHGEPNGSLGAVDDEAGRYDGDDHGVADTDLGEALVATQYGHGEGGDQLPRSSGRALHADHEVVDGERAGVVVGGER